MKIHIRKANLADLPILQDFHQQLIQAERPFDETIKEGNFEYYDLKEIILSDHSDFLLAEIHDSIVGCGYAKILTAKHYLNHQQYTHLGCIFVLPEYRGKGVSQEIINELLQWSKDRNIHEIRLEVYSDNYGAIKAYEKVGMKQHMIEMRIDLKKAES